ncbi:MAG TPA: hypothetical protein VGG10_05910 [Rhizomicrobium sp.]
MRALIRLFACLALILAATPALAAPTCQDQSGGTIRCGTPGAMPVGWTVLEHPPSATPATAPDTDDPNAALKAICIVGMLLALIALMPEFDGRKDEDWDKQERDGDQA